MKHIEWKRTVLSTKRKERGLSMRQVEKATGISPARLSLYERALVEPKVTRALKLAKFYNTTVECLFG
jgi:transcriptional regulator with XRE-family HTH domain